MRELLLGPAPAHAAAARGPALLIATGRCVWDDLAAFGDARFTGARMALNRMGLDYYCEVPIDLRRQTAPQIHRIDYWCSLHPANQLWRMKERQQQVDGRAIPPLVTNKRPKDWPDDMRLIACPFSNNGGTTMLFGALSLLLFGYEPVAICGGPLDNSGHYYDPPGRSRENLADGAIAMTWGSHMGVLRGKVFAMSGRPRDWLGAPPADFPGFA